MTYTLVFIHDILKLLYVSHLVASFPCLLAFSLCCLGCVGYINVDASISVTCKITSKYTDNINLAYPWVSYLGRGKWPFKLYIFFKR